VSVQTALLQVRELTFVRDFDPLFERLSFSVERGEAWLLRGPNGSGKSTLLKVLAGLWRADDGEVTIAGRSANGRDWPREQLLFLGHGGQLKLDLDPLDNLRWLCGLYGARSDRASLRAALATFDVDHLESQPVRFLSQGQRKRVLFALLKQIERPLWLLDEPYANLDADGVDRLDALISAQLATGAVVLSSHGALKPAWPHLRELHLGALRC
jgi:heme exporter protein A